MNLPAMIRHHHQRRTDGLFSFVGGVIFMMVMMTMMTMKQIDCVTIEKSAYKDIVIEIKDNVPVAECATILTDLEIALTSASQFLFTALDGRAYIGNAIVMVPPAWPSNCLPKNRTLTASRGERSDITLTESNQIYRDAIWTQQSGGCGEQGDQIFGSYVALKRQTVGRELVREWAKYRYGIFDEIGFANDLIYPRFYRMDREQTTGCSDAAIQTNGLCDIYQQKNFTMIGSLSTTSTTTTTTTTSSASATDSTARSSIMFSAESPNVVMFCDEGTHNRYAPTKHNQMCNRRSTLDVILKHTDFDPTNLVAVESPTTIINTTPTIEYKKRSLTRYVLIIDETRDTMIRESWSFLRMAIRKWVVYDLPANTEVGIILANDTASAKIFDISSLDIQKNRDYIASFIPFSPSETQRPACINCAVQDAIDMLNDRYQRDGPANSVIFIVAPGMDFNTDYVELGRSASKSKINIATVNYPGVIRRQPLDLLSSATSAENGGGISYTVYEKKQNGEKSLLTTYFELSNIFYNILLEHYEGNRLNLPMEIHRKELIDVSDDMGSSSTSPAKRISRQITSAFMFDSSMGTPSSFFIYTHNAENPLIHSAKLTSPSGMTTSIRSDQRLPVKQLAISAIIGETGTWTYTIDRYNGDPQPHYVQVMATPKTTFSPVITARAWFRTTHSGQGPIILYCEVKKGELPVSAALVEVTVTRPDVICNSTGNRCRETFRLFDTGSGDPDITRGDGIYTRYFNVAGSGKGAYKFDIIVTDNGNIAYSLTDHFMLHLAGESGIENDAATRCCGSFIPCPSKQPLPSFQRVLPSITVFLTQDQVSGNRPSAITDLGHIGDLRAELIDNVNDFMKIRLSWTSPDMGGLKVSRYEIRYSTVATNVIDQFDTPSATERWEHDQALPFSIGDDSSLIMNISAIEPQSKIIGKRIFIAMRPYSELTTDAKPGPISNVVNAFIPKPIPPTPPTYATDTFFSFASGSNGDDGSNNSDGSIGGFNDATSSKPSLYNLNWELLIPIIAGICLVGILICGFCYFCIVKRQKKVDFPKKKLKTSSTTTTTTSATSTGSNKGNKVDNSINSPIHIVPHHQDLLNTSPDHHQHSLMSNGGAIGNNIGGGIGGLQQPQVPNYPSELLDMPDHHTIGLPIYSSEEEIHKKRYSIVNEQEHHLIQKMKHQHIQRVYRPCPLSVISSNNNNSSGGSNRIYGTTTGNNGGGIGPYDSWTPSQLLQENELEHDRLNSPYDDLVNQSLIGQHQQQQQQQHHHQHPHHHHQQQQQQQQQHQQQSDQYSLMNGNNTNHQIQQQQQQQHHHQLIDHMSINGAPPVPPLPYATIPDSYPGNIYSSGVIGNGHHMMDQPPAYVSSSSSTSTSSAATQRIGLPPAPLPTNAASSSSNQFNTSLQGSMNSVNSSERKKTRNVTMV